MIRSMDSDQYTNLNNNLVDIVPPPSPSRKALFIDMEIIRRHLKDISVSAVADAVVTVIVLAMPDACTLSTVIIITSISAR